MGNQMFQYAMGLDTARRLGTKLALDTTHLRSNWKRQYSLGLFNINDPQVEGSEPTVSEACLPYDSSLVKRIKDGDVLLGYWQSEKYFKDLDTRIMLRHRFFPKGKIPAAAEDFSNEILATGERGVMIGVRRGDYLVSSYHGVMTSEYYLRGLSALGVQKPILFVFSDDPVWCRRVLAMELPHPIHIFQGDVSVPNHLGREDVDLWLMSQCSNFVIGNSTFHWWGAWLSTRFNVVAPKNWFASSKEDPRDICPEHWLRV
ncbi:Glycosyl transferase family 11 [uncultured archaeon]|nr:Glycosyl transferase family 11 [uncultured archaeon]